MSPGYRDLGLLNRKGGNRARIYKHVNISIGQYIKCLIELASTTFDYLEQECSPKKKKNYQCSYLSRLWNSLLWSVISASLIEQLKRYCVLIVYCRQVSLSTKLRPLLSYQTSNVFLQAFLNMPNTPWVTSPT